jgi:hypothetical protein
MENLTTSKNFLDLSITHHQRWENPHKNPNLPETHDLIHLHDHHSLPMQLGALDD